MSTPEKRKRQFCYVVGLILLLGTAAYARGNRIVPGRSVGKVHLGESDAVVSRSLGKPDDGDAAMGHFWSYWHSHKPHSKGKTPNAVEVYSVRTPNGDNGLVQQIRVTSPSFVTTNGISTRSTLGQIQRRFPRAVAIAYYIAEGSTGRVYVYDDVKQGIAFEVLGGSGSQPKRTSGRCVAITVHKPGDKVNEIYSPRHDYKTL